MPTLNRIIVLDTLIRHETLTLIDFAKKENLGMVPNEHHLRLLLDELEQGSYVQKLDGAQLCTYTITDKGIAEGKRLNEK
jgi:hypothetical protein